MADGDPIRIGRTNTASNPGNETILNRNVVGLLANRPVLLARNLGHGDGIHGEGSGPSSGVQGTSAIGIGVVGRSTNSENDQGYGVGGYSSGRGPYSTGVIGTCWRGTGVDGNSSSSYGVRGNSTSGTGVSGLCLSGFSGTGVDGICSDGTGVSGSSGTGTGVLGSSTSGTGVLGSSTSGVGVSGSSGSAPGVQGSSTSGYGVLGISGYGTGVYGLRTDPAGVAGFFDGGVTVANGDLTVVNGNKPFKIDHPLDPQNKYLSHNAVESSERKNVYDGVALLDEDGEASVELPEWFEALNGDFRYQLTAVGGSAPGLHVAEELSENRFKIAGGEDGMKVCWQVTGTRKDRWAAANPFEVEQEKPEEERGRYLEPSLYDAPEEQRVMIVPMEQRPPEPPGIDFVRLEEEHRRQLDELRRQEEEQRRKMEDLRWRMEEHEEEAPPEST
jgi:hypothetical protein